MIEEIMRAWEKLQISNLRFFAGECAFIEDFVVTAWNKSGMSFDTSDETMWVSSDWETWEWPEFGGWWAWWHFGWTFESNNG